MACISEFNTGCVAIYCPHILRNKKLDKEWISQRFYLLGIKTTHNICLFFKSPLRRAHDNAVNVPLSLHQFPDRIQYYNVDQFVFIQLLSQNTDFTLAEKTNVTNVSCSGHVGHLKISRDKMTAWHQSSPLSMMSPSNQQVRGAPPGCFSVFRDKF